MRIICFGFIKPSVAPIKGQSYPGKIGMPVSFAKLEDGSFEIFAAKRRGNAESEVSEASEKPVKMEIFKPDAAVPDQQGFKKAIAIPESTISCLQNGAAGGKPDAIMIDPFRGGFHLPI